MMLFHPLNSCTKAELTLLPFAMAEWASHLPRLTQPGRGRAGIGTRSVGLQSPPSCHIVPELPHPDFNAGDPEVRRGKQAHRVHEWTAGSLTHPPPPSLCSLMRTPGLYSSPLSIWTTEKRAGYLNKEQRGLPAPATFLSSGTRQL